MADKKATLNLTGEAAIELKVLSPTLGTDVIDVSTLGSKGYFTYDPSLPLPRPVNQKSRLSMVIKGSYCTVDTPLINWQKTLLIWKFATFCYTAKHPQQKSMKPSKRQ